MIAECTVEPEVMARWTHFQSLHGDFGVGQGRLLCEFPKKWRKCVMERARELERDGVNSPLQTQRMIDQFQNGSFRRGLVSSRRDYPEGRSWIEAARSAEPPFDMIIHSSPPASEKELCAGEFIRTDAPFPRPHHAEVRRLADPLIDCGWPCFLRANELYLIDPYFDPVSAKFGKVLGRFLTRLEREREGTAPKRIEVHTKLTNEYNPSIQRRNWERWATEHLPSNWKLKVVHWKTLDTGSRLHARYILTEFGGLDYNWGIDEDPTEFTQVGLIADEYWQSLYHRFASYNTNDVSSPSTEHVFEIAG